MALSFPTCPWCGSQKLKSISERLEGQHALVTYYKCGAKRIETNDKKKSKNLWDYKQCLLNKQRKNHELTKTASGNSTK